MAMVTVTKNALLNGAGGNGSLKDIDTMNL